MRRWRPAHPLPASLWHLAPPYLWLQELHVGVPYIPYYGTESSGRTMNDQLTIGRLAEAAEVNVETIRYYQRRGLLDEPDKPVGGQRRYSSADATRVAFIKRAQQLGFTLEEVKDLVLL